VPRPVERLAMQDDARLGFKAETDQATVDRHMERYRQAVHAARTLWGTGGTWLDLGCGTGYGAEVIGRVADTYIGVDISDRAVAYAKRHHGGDRRHFIWASHRTWPLTLEQQQLPAPDVVVCIEAYEHLRASEQAVLLYRVAKYMDKSGVLVVMCPLGNGPSAANPYHLHEPTIEELGHALARSFRYWSVAVCAPYTSTGGEQATQALGLGSRMTPIPE